MSTQLIAFGSKLYHCQSIRETLSSRKSEIGLNSFETALKRSYFFKNKRFQLEILLILVLTYKRVGPILNAQYLNHVLVVVLLQPYCHTGILQFITDDNFTLTLTIFRFRLCTSTWKDGLVHLVY